ncbi:MAG: MATE family efflux transporter [Rhodospirillaceae bacterium]
MTQPSTPERDRGLDPAGFNKRIWMLALPIMATNVTVPLLGLVDTAVIGRLPGAEFMGAVAVGAVIVNVIYSSLNFLRMGTTGLTAQSYGARDADQIRSWLARVCILSVALGLALVALQIPILAVSYWAMEPSGAVWQLTQDYFRIRIWGAPAALFNFALLGWFFGLQNMRAALITQVSMNGLNMGLDIWFVLGLGWGVDGVAYATIISEYASVGLGLIIASGQLKKLGGHWRWDRIRDMLRLRVMFQVNRDIFLRSVFLQIAFVLFTAIGAGMGDQVLAANAVLLQFTHFSAYALDGFANAAEALAGEAVGAKDRELFRRAVKVTTIWSILFAALFGGAYWLAGPALVDLVTTVEAVRQTAYEYLPWMVALPLISIMSYEFDGIYIGATWTAEMRNSMALSLLAFAVAVYFQPADWGNHGLWAAFTVFMAMRGLTMSWAYPRLARDVGR